MSSILGCGLGLHILELMQSKRIKYLIVYEPEIQYFQCSVLVTKWSEVFELAKKNGTQIFLQIGKDGRDLLSDINELNGSVDISAFYFYKHYNHTIFNELELELSAKLWQQLLNDGISFNSKKITIDILRLGHQVLISQVIKIVNQSQSYTKKSQSLREILPCNSL